MYLGDPRENAICLESGCTFESDNRRETMYKWNGMVLDLCGMDPQDKVDGYMAPPTYKQAKN